MLKLLGLVQASLTLPPSPVAVRPVGLAGRSLLLYGVTLNSFDSGPSPASFTARTLKL